MDFCEKCGGIMDMVEGHVACVACGHKSKKKIKIEVSEKIQKKEAIAVINEDSDNTFPVIDMTCPECKNKKSYFWTIQTRSSDESETKFYKCVKCKYTWRKYR